MYLISKGKNKSLAELAEEHFYKLNYKTDRITPLIESPISYLEKIYDQNKKGKLILKKGKAGFFKKWIENDYKLLRDVFTSGPNELLVKIKEIDNLMSLNNITSDDVKEDFKYIFRYDNWRDTERCKWFFDELGITVCPYCNHEEIYRTPGSSKLYFDYDHYFLQSEYPYLALSFYNLVPSCHKCNSHAKGAKNFSIASHLHPYSDNYHLIAEFTLSDISIRFDDKFDIILKCKDLPNKIRLDNFNGVLELQDRFNSNQGKMKVISVKKKQNVYSETQIQEYIKNPELIDINSRQDAINFISDIPLGDQKIIEVPYGKLLRDMAIIFHIY